MVIVRVASFGEHEHEQLPEFDTLRWANAAGAAGAASSFGQKCFMVWWYQGTERQKCALLCFKGKGVAPLL